MPIINLTQDIMDRGKHPEPGWSFAKLNSCDEFKAATGNSMNYPFEFVCESGPEKSDTNKGRYCTYFVNSKALGQDGGRGIPDAVNKFMLMVAALHGINRNEVAADGYETDKLIGKSCWIKIEAVTDTNGKLSFAITDFSKEVEVPF